MSFDTRYPLRMSKYFGLNPFGTGQCLSTLAAQFVVYLISLNPFGTGQCLSTSILGLALDEGIASQSLWNRAVSFDLLMVAKIKQLLVCLNPFGTGQCLSTYLLVVTHSGFLVSIPLEQGSVFRHTLVGGLDNRIKSQSLWNRAVSFDVIMFGTIPLRCCLNPFGTGQCLSTNHLKQFLLLLLCLNPFGTGQCLSTAVVF